MTCVFEDQCSLEALFEKSILAKALQTFSNASTVGLDWQQCASKVVVYHFDAWTSAIYWWHLSIYDVTAALFVAFYIHLLYRLVLFFSGTNFILMFLIVFTAYSQSHLWCKGKSIVFMVYIYIINGHTCSSYDCVIPPLSTALPQGYCQHTLTYP